MDYGSNSEYMSMDHDIAQTRSVYSYISYELRWKLIQMIKQYGLSIYKAAKQLNINYSTAKAIIRNYRRKGHVYRRKKQLFSRQEYHPFARQLRRQVPSMPMQEHIENSPPTLPSPRPEQQLQSPPYILMLPIYGLFPMYQSCTYYQKESPFWHPFY